MTLTNRELWTELHGMLLGALYLMAFTGGLVALWDLRAGCTPDDRIASATRRLAVWTWTMAVVAWLTVIVGTYVVYPWYRAVPPAGTGATATALAHYPKYALLASPTTAEWHKFAMEWKEHLAWLAPILATAVAVLVTRYARRAVADAMLRRAILGLYVLAFTSAGVAGLLGALIDKAAPVR